MLHKSLPARIEEPVDDAGNDPVPVEPVLAIIDGALAAYAGRELISRDDVINRLLDLRNELQAAMLFRDLELREPLLR